MSEVDEEGIPRRSTHIANKEIVSLKNSKEEKLGLKPSFNILTRSP